VIRTCCRIATASLLAILSAAARAEDPAPGKPPLTLHLDGTTQIQIAASAARSEEQLVRDWGQFEFTLPSAAFPLPAPNCKGRIRLRLIAVKPSEPRRSEILKARWITLQALRALAGGGGAALDLALDTRHYTVRDAQGLRLQYCNAFSNGAVK